ncbi:hypothetical protein PILCRDRAFT_130388 [Piloderma croceum F 1598]|uniref:Uncharacterized protein n=1 Tax=Piloderma croceum (strain F 1598) TaxID=765440 RepID=A0A0C3BY42_PILCF|nr:hypothetical protein PILCRDRAFT_130388 [Piloderma croceum F 1598]
MRQTQRAIYSDSNTQTNQPAHERIGAGNEGITDCFEEGVVIRVPSNQGAKIVASDNTRSTHAFTGAQIVVFDGASPDEIVSSTSIASNNDGVEHAFKGAVITTTANKSALHIASGNKDMKRCFGGIRIGVGVGPWVAGGTTIPTKQGGCPIVEETSKPPP